MFDDRHFLVDCLCEWNEGNELPGENPTGIAVAPKDPPNDPTVHVGVCWASAFAVFQGTRLHGRVRSDLKEFRRKTAKSFIVPTVRTGNCIGNSSRPLKARVVQVG